MRLKLWAGGLVSLGLLAFIFSKIDFHRLWEVLRSVDLGWVAAAGVLNLVFYIIRAERWRFLMEPVKKGVPLIDLLSATIIGFMANNILPARLGEFARAYVLGRRESVPASSVFATIVVERLFDSLAVLMLLVYVLATMPESIAGGGTAGMIQKAGYVSLGACAVLISVVAFFVAAPGRAAAAVDGILRPISPGFAAKAVYLTEKFASGLRVVKSPRLLSRIIFYTLLHWLPLFIPVMFFFKAFGLHYGVYQALFFLVITLFSVAVPSTPGFVGTYEAAGVGALVLLGMDKEAALGFTILAHAVSFVPITLLGFIFLSRENLSLGGLKKAEAET